MERHDVTASHCAQTNGAISDAQRVWKRCRGGAGDDRGGGGFPGWTGRAGHADVSSHSLWTLWTDGSRLADGPLRDQTSCRRRRHCIGTDSTPGQTHNESGDDDRGDPTVASVVHQ